ncbi:hypothetical protein D7X33_09105 [Butyricicoccus sp. 1XD8-22]|nr:hypothetical protein D7X33_09105 [Butyricicoccus sp. 1XD8-22]
MSQVMKDKKQLPYIQCAESSAYSRAPPAGENGSPEGLAPLALPRAGAGVQGQRPGALRRGRAPNETVKLQ